MAVATPTGTPAVAVPAIRPAQRAAGAKRAHSPRTVGKEAAGALITTSFVHTPETTRRKPPPAPHRPTNPVLASALDECPTYGRRNYHRRFALKVARAANRAGLGKLAARIGHCSQTLGYGPDGRLVSREACRARECSMCASARSGKWAQRLHATMPAIVAEHPTWRFILITPTVSSVPVLHLRDTLTQLHKALEKMARRAAFAPVGWIRNTEETIANGYAHPHAHLLCAVEASYFAAPLRKVKGANGRPRIVPGYMRHKQWQLLWGECLGLDVPSSYFDVPGKMTQDDWRALWPNDDAPVIDVRAIAGDVTTKDGRKALYEITKYGTKPGDLLRMRPDDFRRLHHQLKGTRTISVCGALAPYLKAMEDENDDAPEALPDVAIAAQWDENAKRYLTDFGEHLERAQDQRRTLREYITRRPVDRDVKAILRKALTRLPP